MNDERILVAAPRAGPGRTLAGTLLFHASLIMVIVIVLIAVQQWRRGEGQAQAPSQAGRRQAGSAPASGTSRPATLTFATTTRPKDTGESNLSPAAIELNESEKTAFGAVIDRNSKLDETAFYMLLGRAGKLGKLDKDDFDGLTRPAVENLLASPQLYRAQPMRISLFVFGANKLAPGDGLSYSRYWPRDKPVWRLNAMMLAPVKKEVYPVIVFVLEDPMPLLGKGHKIDISGEHQYKKPGKRLEVAVVFYKIYATQSMSRKQRDYPVFVAWQLGGKSRARFDKKGASTLLTAVLGIILVLLAGLVFLKRYIQHVKKGDDDDAPVRYRPLRDLSAKTDRAAETDRAAKTDRAAESEAADSEAAEGLEALAEKADQAPQTEAEQADVEVDPLLKQAAEEYRKERRQSDGKDRGS